MVLALCAWGLRPNEVARLHIRQFVLDVSEDEVPYIVFEERKNGPGEVSLLYGREVLEERLAGFADHDEQLFGILSARDNSILDAVEDARAEIRQKSLDSLTPHQRIVYEIVREHCPVGPSEIHERYSEDVADPRTKRTVRAYMSQMTQYNLFEADGSSRDREYTAIDQSSLTLAEQGD